MLEKKLEPPGCVEKCLDLLTSRAFEREARSYERGARASEREARASESSTCFPCRQSHQVTSFWRGLLRMLHAALPIKLSKYFSHLAKSINSLVMEWRRKIHQLKLLFGLLCRKTFTFNVAN